uniref:Uncharacterized protein n=1 Tax=Sphingobacterium sp. (strain 21) TaxID=743722 RepID=F4C895_SPHS2
MPPHGRKDTDTSLICKKQHTLINAVANHPVSQLFFYNVVDGAKVTIIIFFTFRPEPS